MKHIICYFLVCSHLTTGYIEEACIIPCPSDCKLSEWSNWSRCSKSCGSGVKVRSKWLREKPYNGGRPCPKLDHVNQVSWERWAPCVCLALRVPGLFEWLIASPGSNKYLNHRIKQDISLQCFVITPSNFLSISSFTDHGEYTTGSGEQCSFITNVFAVLHFLHSF